MVKYEFDTLVLDQTFTKQDQDAVNAFLHESLLKDRKRILEELERNASNGTLSMAVFKLKQIVMNTKEIDL